MKTKLVPLRSQAFPGVRSYLTRGFSHLGEAFSFYWFDSNGNGGHTAGGYCHVPPVGAHVIRATDGKAFRVVTA